MIVFDLACARAGHVFEAWFGSTGDYEAQQARGLVSCPICGDASVAKAMMAPRVPAKSNSTRSPAPAPAPAPANAPPLSPKALKGMMTRLAEAQKRALDGSDYVGDRFAAEARAIHLGESEQRAIHGVATPKEARGLVEDGVGIAPLPFPVRPPGQDH